jgi:hypothetical protein
MRTHHLLGLMAMLGACGGGHRAGPVLPAVPVEGGRRDIRLLVGTWAGEFVSDRGVRRGTIAFALRSAGDTAHGRVLLRGPAPPPGCSDPVSQATEPRAVGEIALALGRVNVGGDRVGGWLRPYRDPELGCWTDTWFEGSIDGDTLAGMYFSHPADTSATVRLGTWWVARQR